jgi:hypothetical protein
MTLDIRGSIKNTKLSSNRYVVFEELISNAIDSFLIRKHEDASAPSMRVEIEVDISATGLLEDREVMAVSCKDNGCGLGDDQLKAFLTKDTSYKDDLPISGIGKCKGAGRIQFFHHFSALLIDSTYRQGSSTFRREMRYSEPQKQIDFDNFISSPGNEDAVGTTIRLEQFTEHTTAAVRDGSRRLFPRKMNELIEARVAQLTGKTNTQPKLAGIISSVCAIGLDEDAAMDTEEYLVDKYSLSSKHKNGLNMIPGGREGLRCLHKLSLGGGSLIIETDDRESVLEKYLQDHPQLGIPKPGVAEKWNNPAYAEAVICARENRLSADQVREIRYLAALGNSIDRIRFKIGALNDGQVARVLEGRTYTRIR